MAQHQDDDERAQRSLYRAENRLVLSGLRALRKRAKLTQADLAQRMGRSQNYVTSIERGLTRIDGLQIHDWAKACGYDLRKWADLVERALATGTDATLLKDESDESGPAPK